MHILGTTSQQSALWARQQWPGCRLREAWVRPSHPVVPQAGSTVACLVGQQRLCLSKGKRLVPVQHVLAEHLQYPLGLTVYCGLR